MNYVINFDKLKFSFMTFRMIPISHCKINVLHRKYFGHIDILIYYILQIFLNPCQENQCATSFENIIIDEMRLEKTIILRMTKIY